MIGSHYGILKGTPGGIGGAAAVITGAESSSERLARLASRALQDPGSLTDSEIRSLAGSVLTQAPDR